MEFIFWIGVNWIVGYLIGKSKDRIGESVLVSVLLGPIGWIIALCLSPKGRKCPQCAEIVKQDALVCRYCGFSFAAPAKAVAARAAKAPPRVQVQERFTVAKDGAEVGKLTRTEIEHQIRIGRLSASDYYLDLVANDWMPLDLLVGDPARR